MAQIIDNKVVRPSPKHGYQFELEVLDALRQGLPDTYWVLHCAVLSARERWMSPARLRPAEVDLVVAGPNGVFLLEAKVREIVRGSLWSHWAYSRRAARPGQPDNYDRGLAMKMRVNLKAAGDRIGFKGKGRFHPYENATGFFVFPQDVDVAIDHDGVVGEVFEEGMFRIARLHELCERILAVPRPPVRPKQPLPPPLSGDDARVIVEYFEAGTRPSPEMSGPFRVEWNDNYRTAANGLSFTVHALYDELGQRLRGKWYDMSGLGQKKRAEFDEQVRRHARVLMAIDDRHVLPYRFFLADEIGRGYWVIEGDVDADVLADRLRVGPPVPARETALGIAKGIRAVHAAGFKCRDLDPQSILLQRGTDLVILAGFETAKGADDLPTVIADGFELTGDGYRAPEVRHDAHNVDVRADVFSWGALTFHLVTGQKLERDEQLPLLDAAGLRPAIASLIRACTAPYPHERPANIDVVLATLKSWR